MFSRGPIIRTLELVGTLSGLAAIVALVFSLTVFSARLDDIQTARERSALDTCRIIDRLVVRAYGEVGEPRVATATINALGLDNCIKYAAGVRNGTVHILRPVFPHPSR